MKSWSDINSSSTAKVLEWAGEQPWAKAMASCMQDAGWHAEGDVWTHTKMVVAELERLPEWRSLDRDSQMKLLFTAIFHDLGKPATTVINPETGRTRSPNHAGVGVEIAREAMRELGCDLKVREEIGYLVRFHGRPSFLLEKADPAHEVIRLSWLVNHRLLYLFAMADSRGRKTNDMSRALENLEFWKIAAEENGCFDQPYPFANDSARVAYYRGTLSSLHYVPREEHRCRVTMMSGLPGAGKDTWLNEERPELPMVSLDELRTELDVEATDDQGQVIQAARDACREYLRAGRDFAFNATNTMRQTRKRWIDLFLDYGARVEVVYVEPPLKVIFEQNKRRSKAVPSSAMRKLVAKLEPPTWTEAHELRWVG